MSRVNPTKVEELALEVPCYCGPVGQWCKTKTGRWATWLHSHRSWPIQEAMGIAYEEAEQGRRMDMGKRQEALEQLLAQGVVTNTDAQNQLRRLVARRWYW